MLGIGIIGCGAISKFHIDSYKGIAGVKIMAVSDTNSDNALRTGLELGVDSYNEYIELIKRTDIDIVSICTPSGLHGDIAVNAARHGKHVIVEKPIEVTLEKINRMIDACKENNVKLACIFNNRYREGNVFLKKAIDEGRFGKIINANAYVRWYREPRYYSGSNWRGTWALDGGGALMNQSIHYIDLLLWFAGGVHSIYACTGTLLNKGMETEDTAVSVLKFKSGALGAIVAGTSMYPGFPARIEITGEKGSATISDGVIDTWKFRDTDPLDDEALQYMNMVVDNSRASDPMAFDCTYHKMQLQSIINAIRGGTDIEIDGNEAKKPVELILSIYESAAGDKVVFL